MFFFFFVPIIAKNRSQSIQFFLLFYEPPIVHNENITQSRVIVIFGVGFQTDRVQDCLPTRSSQQKNQEQISRDTKSYLKG